MRRRESPDSRRRRRGQRKRRARGSRRCGGPHGRCRDRELRRSGGRGGPGRRGRVVQGRRKLGWLTLDKIERHGRGGGVVNVLVDLLKTRQQRVDVVLLVHVGRPQCFDAAEEVVLNLGTVRLPGGARLASSLGLVQTTVVGVSNTAQFVVHLGDACRDLVPLRLHGGLLIFLDLHSLGDAGLVVLKLLRCGVKDGLLGSPFLLRLSLALVESIGCFLKRLELCVELGRLLLGLSFRGLLLDDLLPVLVVVAACRLNHVVELVILLLERRSLALPLLAQRLEPGLLLRQPVVVGFDGALQRRRRRIGAEGLRRANGRVDGPFLVFVGRKGGPDTRGKDDSVRVGVNKLADVLGQRPQPIDVPAPAMVAEVLILSFVLDTVNACWLPKGIVDPDVKRL